MKGIEREPLVCGADKKLNTKTKGIRNFLS
jgi:hypothetical protein